MNQNNDLIASGLLYEGNFTEWVERMRRVLSQYYPGCRLTRSGSSHDLWCVQGIPMEDYYKAVTIIWCHVSPSVRLWVPLWYYHTPTELLNDICKKAQPFRLVGLPPEIRTRVYPLATRSATGTVTAELNWERYSYSLPAIMYTGKLVRAEAMATYYHEHTVILRFNAVYNRTYKVEAIRTWTTMLGPSSVRLLRRVSVDLPVPPHIHLNAGEEDILNFRLELLNSGALELRVAAHPRLTLKSQRLVANHTAMIRRTAQALSLQGEALVLVLTTRSDFWGQLECT